MKYHPDRNKDDKEAEKKFKEATAAYEAKRSRKRAAYDQYGHDAFRQGGMGVRKAFGDFAGGFSDIFEEFLVVVLEVPQDNEGHKEEVIFVTICPLLFKRLLLVKNRK